jgi:hypothetical protein
MNQFKAFIRVIKSLKDPFDYFAERDIIKEPLILAEDKAEVKKMVVEKYPQFFQNGKIYEKETKDKAQFFYVVIFPLYEWEKELINKGEWKCSHCGQIHVNPYESKPRTNDRLFGSEIMFCRSDDDYCMKEYTKAKNEGIDLPDDEFYITATSPVYIYRITEKETGKCYIGKTKNAVFFRWWNHLKRNSSPFGIYFKSKPLSDWSFDVLCELPCGTKESDVFKIESDYMIQFDSINNGFNTTISNKDSKIIIEETISLPSLFDEN